MKKTLEKITRTTAKSYNNLAMVLQNLGEYAQAKTLFQKAVASDEKNFGEDHPNYCQKLQQFGR
jgi:tetratricopeptide (TPR) repeat protein